MIKNFKIMKAYQKATIVKRITISSIVAILIGCGVVDASLKEKTMIYVEDEKYLSSQLYYVIDDNQKSHICLQDSLIEKDMTKGYYQINTNELVATSNLYGKITANKIVPISELTNDFSTLNQYIDNNYLKLLEYIDYLAQPKKIRTMK